MVGNTNPAGRPLRCIRTSCQIQRRARQLAAGGIFRHADDPALRLRDILFPAIERNWQALSLRIEAENRADQMAFHDPLTGLPNRCKANAEIARAIERSAEVTAAVLAIDLNRFKPVNDLDGNAVGDQLPVAVGERLKESLGEFDPAYRMGGGEFLIIAQVQGDDDLIRLAKSTSDLFDKPFVLELTSLFNRRAWLLSNTMDAGFCVAALARFGKPEIFNTDQGRQFTSCAFTSVLRDAEVRISMDGRGRWIPDDLPAPVVVTPV